MEPPVCPTGDSGCASVLVVLSTQEAVSNPVATGTRAETTLTVLFLAGLGPPLKGPLAQGYVSEAHDVPSVAIRADSWRLRRIERATLFLLSLRLMAFLLMETTLHEGV